VEITSDQSLDRISLRPAAAADRNFLFQVYAGTRQDELALVPWTEPEKKAFLQMQFDAQDAYYTANYPGALFQVILLQDVPIGRLYVKQYEREIRIMDIALLPEYRNRGIGSSLLHGILSHGQSLTLPVTIHVERFNPALRLYERLGFKPIEDKGVYLLLERVPDSK
jgi:ribosomal protein S18 acetylase RimI-like enzyme